MKGITLKLVKTLKAKKVYNVFLDGKDTKFVGQESFTDGSIKRYPFYLKDNKIVNKYNSIKCLTTRDKVRPKSGFSITESKGFGFTNPKGISNLFYYFQEKYPSVSEVVFIGEGKTEIIDNRLYITINDFGKIENTTGNFFETKKSESQFLFQNILSKYLPKEFKVPTKKKYIPGSIQNYLNTYNNITLSKSDQEELTTLLINSGLAYETIVSTKQELDIVYIEDIIEEYKALLKQITQTKTLEEKWHQFFKKHTWIFTQIFSFPAVFLKDKVNIGGHSIKGDSDKIVDFLYRNNITNNIAFIEIKTHLSGLITNTVYRKPDIFAIDSELSGAIVQVLDQKNKLLKNFHSIVGDVANSLNSVCVVIAGNSSNFPKKGQSESFELFRWSNKDVMIIPFDELLNKVENLLALFKKKTI